MPTKENIKHHIPSFVKEQLNGLEHKRKRAKKWFSGFSILIATINLTTIVLAIYIIVDMSKKYSKSGIPASAKSVELMSYFVALLTVAIFVVSFIVIYFNSVSKRTKFTKAIAKIRFIALQHKNQKGMYKNKGRDKLAIDNIHEIYNDLLSKREKASLKNTMYVTLLGGNGE